MRILQSRNPATINTDWFQNKLVTAFRLRAALDEKTTTGYRLVHGENDGLPGLVLDRYAEALVLKLYTPAWVPHLQNFCDALAQVSPAAHLILRLNRSLQKQTEFLNSLSDGMTLTIQTPPSLILFKENGLIFESDPLRGQKTGFFLDQRDNRARVEKLSKDKSVLNVFAYTGGFSVYAARGGAKEVVSVDMSAPALEAAVLVLDDDAAVVADLVEGGQEPVPGDLAEPGQARDLPADAGRHDAVLVQSLPEIGRAHV